jgi:hypothetical protein
MKAFLILISAMMLLRFSGIAQDVIYKTDGDSISCKILRVDSTKIYFDLVQEDNVINTFISRDETLGYKYYQRAAKGARFNSSTKHIFCFSVDPLGFITMGPAVIGEFLFQIKNKRVGFGLYTGLRLTNLGLVSNVWLSGGEMGFFSYTVPISIRIYPKTRFRTDGIFVGPHFEFGKTIFTDDQKNYVRVFGVEVGYKWTYKSGFTLELVDMIGLIQTKYIEESGGSFPDYNEETWQNLAFVPYMISVKLGYSF